LEPINRYKKTNFQSNLYEKSFLSTTKPNRKDAFGFATGSLALFASYVAGLICALAMANELPDKTKKEFKSVLVDEEHFDG